MQWHEEHLSSNLADSNLMQLVMSNERERLASLHCGSKDVEAPAEYLVDHRRSKVNDMILEGDSKYLTDAWRKSQSINDDTQQDLRLDDDILL